VIARDGLGLEDLEARRLVGAQQVLLDLVLHVAEAGLVDGHAGELFGVAARRLAHRLDHLLAGLDAGAHPLLLRAGGRGAGAVEVVEDARAP
jgi:hypothetical protein